METRNKVRLQVRSTRTFEKEIELPEGKTIDDVFDYGMGIGFNPYSSMGTTLVHYYDNKTTKSISSIKVKQNEMVDYEGSSMVERVNIVDCETGVGKEL
jgi:hypothetical protein